jgi:hypothetical protein
MPKQGPNVWVVRRGAGFSITEEGTGTYLIPPVTHRTAVGIARRLAVANRSELIVQGRSGRIQFRDSHGSDPFPPRG